MLVGLFQSMFGNPVTTVPVQGGRRPRETGSTREHRTARPPEGQRGQRGISLLETLLALFILAVVLLTLCNLFFTARREIRSGGVDALLASSARAQLEALKQLPFDQNPAGGDLENPIQDYHRTVEPSEGRRVLLLWEITDIAPDELKQISVRALPLQGRGLNAGRPREVLLVTYRALTSDAGSQP